MRPCWQQIRDESGTVLVTAVLILAVLTVMGVFATNMTIVNEQIAGNLKASKQALYLAEAGLTHARLLLNWNQGLWSGYGTDAPQTLLPSTSLANLGTYTVTIQAAGGQARRLRATGGNTAGRSQATIEALLEPGWFNTDKAILVGGDLDIGGNASITGTLGNVHANGNLTISGNALVSQNVSATGTYSTSGSPLIGGEAAGSQPRERIPAITPADFYDARDYLLASDGKVYKKGNVGPQPMPQGNWNGWSFNAGSWTLSGTVIPTDGTLYIEGNAKITGNAGVQGNPWIGTLIATGDIEISGTPIMRPPNSTDSSQGNPLFRAGTENLLLVAGKDVKIVGNAQQSFEGIMAAHEQLEVTGNPTLKGFMLAENATTVSNTVINDRVNGDMSLTYNGNLHNPLKGDVQMLSWRQL
jgi:type IV pilus assembly PilX-like protein